MKKVSIFGSCLSASVAKSFINLNDEYESYAVIQHMRSDSLKDLTKEGKFFRFSAEALKDKLISLGVDPELNIRRINMQSKERVAGFSSYVRQSSVIFIDPNYDVSRIGYSIFSGKSWSVPYLLRSSFDFSNLDDVSKIKLSTKQSVENYRAAFKAMLDENSSLKIVYLNYPITGFSKSGINKDRVANSKEIAKLLSVDDERVIMLPLINVRKRCLTEKGAHYFSEEFYDLCAKYITSVIHGEIKPLPSTIKFEQSQVEGYLNGSFHFEFEKYENAHPYENLPDNRFWRKAIAERYNLSISDLYTKKFDINFEDKIATCGSCFAQHIGRKFKVNGFNYFDVEPAPKNLSATDAAQNGYGIYSARYGNVYTAEQLNQLFDQAFQDKLVALDVWKRSDGKYVDPYRTNIKLSGYESEKEVLAARREHLYAVKKMFLELDLFVFTLGLTEAWRDKKTQNVYPLCPGTSAGKFDAGKYEFVNFDYEQTLQAMQQFYDKLMKVNPSAKILLTVSPVPLTATAEDRHVLVSTVESKSILRAVAGKMASQHNNVDYFPSYEIVSSHPFKGSFYKTNLRQVRPEGVDFVMSHFFKQHMQNQVAQLNGDIEEENEEFCDNAFLDL